MTPRWGLTDAAVAVLVAYGLALPLSALVSDPRHPTLNEQVLLTLPLWILAIGVPIWATMTKGNGPAADLGLRIRPLDVPLGLICGVAAQYLVGWGYELLTSDETVRRLSGPAETMGSFATSTWSKVLLIVTTVIVAPVAEELLYRGLVLRSIERRLGVSSPRFATAGAVIITALVFAAMHFQPLQFVGLACFGLLCGALVVRTGRLAPAMAAHVAFNATAIAHLHIW